MELDMNQVEMIITYFSKNSNLINDNTIDLTPKNLLLIYKCNQNPVFLQETKSQDDLAKTGITHKECLKKLFPKSTSKDSPNGFRK